MALDRSGRGYETALEAHAALARVKRCPMLSLHELAACHQEHSPYLAGRRREFVLLWYADRGVEVEEGDRVRCHCSVCGKALSLLLEEFLELETDTDMRCAEHQTGAGGGR